MVDAVVARPFLRCGPARHQLPPSTFPLQRRSVMFEKISDAAEKVASNVSRRAFLGRLGQGALITAGVLGGMHLLAGKAQALWCPTASGGLQKCEINQICTAQGCYTP